MDERITVWIKSEHREWLSRQELQVSDQLRNDLDAYRSMVEHGKRLVQNVLDKKQFALVWEALQGLIIEPAQYHRLGFWCLANIRDAIEMDAADKRHKVDGKLLIDRLNGLTELQWLGLWEMIRSQKGE